MEKKITPQTQAVIDVLKSGGNIYHLARRLGLTISGTSQIVAGLSEKNPRLAEKFKDWPKNLTTGHIFIGDKTDVYGERALSLKTGDHVLVTKLLKKKLQGRRYDDFCEVYAPKIEIEYKYDACLKISGERVDFLIKNKLAKFRDFYKIKGEYYRIVDHIWLTEEEIVNFDLNKMGWDILFNTHQERQKITPLKWLGVVNKRAVVSVHHDWMS